MIPARRSVNHPQHPQYHSRTPSRTPRYPSQPAISVGPTLYDDPLATQIVKLPQRLNDAMRTSEAASTKFRAAHQECHNEMWHCRSQGQGQGPSQGRLLMTPQLRQLDASARQARTEEVNATARLISLDRQDFFRRYAEREAVPPFEEPEPERKSSRRRIKHISLFWERDKDKEPESPRESWASPPFHQNQTDEHPPVRSKSDSTRGRPPSQLVLRPSLPNLGGRSRPSTQEQSFVPRRPAHAQPSAPGPPPPSCPPVRLEQRMGLVIRNPDVPESPPMSSAASSSGSISDDESVHIWSFEELNPYLRIHNQLNSVKEQLVDLQEEYRPTNRLMFASLDHGVLLRDAPENQAFLNHQGVLRELLNATLNLECPDPANTRNCKVCERRDELTGYINARLTLLDRNRKDQWKAEVQHRVNPWQSSRTSMRLPPPPARRPLPPLPFHRRN